MQFGNKRLKVSVYTEETRTRAARFPLSSFRAARVSETSVEQVAQEKNEGAINAKKEERRNRL
jgi:hypothetical protein